MKPKTILLLPVAAACLFLAGCQSDPAPAPIVTKLNAMNSEISTGRAAVVNTTESLRALRDTNEAGLRPMYDAYVKSVADLQAKAGGAGLVADSSMARTENYFAQWQDEINQISDNDLRTKAEGRRADVLKQYQDVQTKMAQLRSSFRPYLGKLQDIQKFLATNLTVAARSTAMSTIREAISLSEPVLKDIDSLSASIDKIAGK